jgi:hypothetical protein
MPKKNNQKGIAKGRASGYLCTPKSKKGLFWKETAGNFEKVWLKDHS